MIKAQYVAFFGGWVAFKNGKALRTRERFIKIFITEEAALNAAKRSKRVWG